MKYLKTIGELKEYLKDIPDESEVILIAEDSQYRFTDKMAPFGGTLNMTIKKVKVLPTAFFGFTE